MIALGITMHLVTFVGVTKKTRGSPSDKRIIFYAEGKQ